MSGDHQRHGRRLQSEIERYHAIKRRDASGYAIDGELRLILEQMNETILQISDITGGERMSLVQMLEDLPEKFDTYMDFLKPIRGWEGVELWGLREERDHAFMTDDFLDVVTSGMLDEEISLRCVAAIPEGVIHSYSAMGGEDSFHLDLGTGERFVFSGITLVRHGERVAWGLVGGEIVDDLSVCDATIRDIVGRRLRQGVDGHGSRVDPSKIDTAVATRSAGRLDGRPDAWRTTAWGTFNLATRSHEQRLVTRATEDLPVILTDDRFSRDGNKEDAEAVARLSPIFDFAVSAFALPAYFVSKVHLVKGQRLPARARRDGERPLSKNDERTLPRFKVVSTLEVTHAGDDASPKAAQGYTPPTYRVEVDGFYRRLSPGSVGKGKDGKPESGRTWVEGHARWKDKPVKPRTVIVKSSVAQALEMALDSIEDGDGIGMSLTF